MYVAGQVQIEFFHGDHLRVPATRRASLDSERRALAGLSNGGDDLFLQMRPQSLAKPNGGGAFAFSQRGRVDAAHDDQGPFPAETSTAVKRIPSVSCFRTYWSATR